MNTTPSPLAELGHELRTPLTAILGYAGAIRERAFGPLEEKYADAAEAIHLAGLHLLAMVDAMTDIGRVERGQAAMPPVVFDMVDGVRTAVSMLQGEADRRAVALTTEPGAPEILVSADPSAVTRIVVNLVGNALKFTPAGGLINVGLTAQGAEVRLTVSDSGPGLTAGKAATGEGLGLLLVRALCGQHGGRFELTDAPGGGAMATVRLPIANGT